MVVATAVIVLYSRGLPGGFLLDDFANLKTLDRLEGPFAWAKLGSVVFSNVSGDMGRLLPLFTFAIQHDAWPGNPAVFKAVNIGLHAFNSLLVVWLALRFADVAHGSRTSSTIFMAVVVGAIWALHPLLVSTVLYTVQRMAIMSAMFMFLGLLVYLAGRRRMSEGRRSGVWLMAAGVCGGTLLAIACKENGALLPLVVLIAEFTLLAGQPRSRAYWIWLAVTVLLPLTVLFGYIAYNFTNWILPGYALRDYTVTERLLTQARVLSEYLFQIAFPQPSSLGLFHDDYPVSRSLADPITTAPATLFVVGLCAAAIALRRRMPALSMGVLWYFGAQLLESGPIPLELYFEHRNYFPLAGLLIGVGIQLTLAVRNVPLLRRYSRYVAVAAFGWLATLAGVSYGEISLWADPYAQAGAWATERPDSVRAQSHWASVLGEMRFSEGSEDVYDGLTARDPGFRLVAISKNCLRGGVRFREGYDEILARMRTMRFSRTVIGALESLANATEAGYCREAASLFFEPTVAVLLDNPNFASRRFHLFVLQGRYRTAEGRYAAARQDFLAALSLRPDVEVALLVVKSAYLGGDQSQGRTDLERARAVNALNRVSRWTYARDIEDWAVAIESMQPNLGTGEKDGGGGGDPSEGPRGNHSNGAARQREAD